MFVGLLTVFQLCFQLSTGRTSPTEDAVCTATFAAARLADLLACLAGLGGCEDSIDSAPVCQHIITRCDRGADHGVAGGATSESEIAANHRAIFAAVFLAHHDKAAVSKRFCHFGKKEIRSGADIAFKRKIGMCHSAVGRTGHLAARPATRRLLLFLLVVAWHFC